MNPVTFDWTISFGNLLTVGGFFFSGVAFVLFMRSDLMVLSSRVANIEGAMRELVQANLSMAEQRGRIETLDDRIDNISTRVDSIINRLMNDPPSSGSSK